MWRANHRRRQKRPDEPGVESRGLTAFIDFAARKLAASAARGIAADFTYNTRKV
jgi:hypothetical protein